MPKKIEEMSAAEVRQLDAVGFHAVGGVSGLNLRVRSPSAKSWVLRVLIGGKRRDICLGGYPDVGLAEARVAAKSHKTAIRDGRDPLAERQARRVELKLAQIKQITFAEAARRCHAARAAEFRNAKHRQDWISSLERFAFASIGDVPVSTIEPAHILAVLEPIWMDRTETATRVRQRIESVMDWATASGFYDGLNPARWRGNLKPLLPTPSKIIKQGHFAALPWKDLPEFMERLRDRKGMAALALEFAILTAARSGEVRGATWAEIDMQERVWRVPADRMKANKAHAVPLSDTAIALLESVPRMAGSDFVFTAPRGGQLSDMTLTQLIRRMGDKVTAHGFRSTFKDWARSTANHPDEVSELALAHVSTDAARAAYARDELLPQRRSQLQDWAYYCAGLPANISYIRGAK